MLEYARPGGAVGNGGEEAEIEAKLEESAARALTDRIKEGAENLWRMLLEAYEGGAHTALGYASWGAYFEAEFGGKKSKAYQLLEAGRVVRAIDANSAIAERPNESQARSLASVAKTDPGGAARIWEAAVEGHGDPTAADVSRMVEEHVGGSSAQDVSELLEKLTPADAIQALTERAGSKEILAALPPLTLAAIERAREGQGTCRDPLHDGDQLGFLAGIVEKHGDAEGALVVGALATEGATFLAPTKGSCARGRARGASAWRRVCARPPHSGRSSASPSSWPTRHGATNSPSPTPGGSKTGTRRWTSPRSRPWERTCPPRPTPCFSCGRPLRRCWRRWR